MGLFKDCGCGCNGKKQEKKFLISLMSALIFFIVASPELFVFVRRIFGVWVASPNGCPSTAGLALHALVFLLIVWGMMNIKTESYTSMFMPEDKMTSEEMTYKFESSPSPSPAPMMEDSPAPEEDVSPAPMMDESPAIAPMVSMPSPMPMEEESEELEFKSLAVDMPGKVMAGLNLAEI